MKTLAGSMLLLMVAMGGTGCAVNPYQPGLLFAGGTRPYQATNNPTGARWGEASQINILGLVSVGNAGIAAAARDGGITEISSVDVNHVMVLGLFSRTTTRVSGN